MEIMRKEGRKVIRAWNQFHTTHRRRMYRKMLNPGHLIGKSSLEYDLQINSIFVVIDK